MILTGITTRLKCITVWKYSCRSQFSVLKLKNDPAKKYCYTSAFSKRLEWAPARRCQASTCRPHQLENKRSWANLNFYFICSWFLYNGWQEPKLQIDHLIDHKVKRFVTLFCLAWIGFFDESWILIVLSPCYVFS